MNWFKKLKSGLQKTSEKISQGVTEIFTHKKLDEATLNALEELLIQSDMGLEMAEKCVMHLRKNRFNEEISEEEVKRILADKVSETLAPVAKPLLIQQGSMPQVILMVGVNGGGKTTTSAKLAQIWKKQGLNVMLVACDTFRAAAIEQLNVWGDRLGIPVIARGHGSDAAALAFDALSKAKQEGVDVLLIDTAGRLHTNEGLMAEMSKIARVLQKIDATAPHHVVLVVDATTGQNAVTQVEMFSKTVPLTGIVLTKLDGSAKGGVLVQIADKFKVPVHAIGVGEQVDDMQPFDANIFARQLMGLEDF